MSDKTCAYCDAPLVKKAHEDNWRFAKRRYCNPACVSRHNRDRQLSGTHGADGLRASWEAARAKRAALLEDAEWIIGTDYPERVAQRLGYEKPESLIRSLARWGRNDLAAKLERAS